MTHLCLLVQVKAAFCQAQINVLLTVKNRRRMPIKVYFFRKMRRYCAYMDENAHARTVQYLFTQYVRKNHMNLDCLIVV